MLFLPLVVVLNFFIKTKYSNYLLLAASLVFYAWGESVYILLMLASIGINWLSGILIDRLQRVKKLLLVLCILVNLLLLGYFKYFGFFTEIVNGLAKSEVIPVKDIALPIGISFFTFQAMSYIIDLYRGNCKVQKNLFYLALYISFFPQLIAGPIVRYRDVEKQIQERTVGPEKFALGLRRFLYGLGKKVIISNCMAELADAAFALPFSELTSAAAWLGAIAYTLQIYYDFSGYSDMAIGLGKMFGFEFLENFNYPYLSRSIREFWQRWHISLGTWFKEYLYIPLGGNRKGTVRTCVNLLVVFFLTGLWHGASWTFVVWGLYYGIFQILERTGLGRFLNKHRIIGWIYCMLLVIFGWVLFRSDTLAGCGQYLLTMLTPWKYGIENLFSLPITFSAKYVTVMIPAILGCGGIQAVAARCGRLEKMWKYSLAELLFLTVVFLYSVMLLTAGTYNPFIYFRF